jgi:tripartite ATP-independent transporter DctM subunit
VSDATVVIIMVGLFLGLGYLGVPVAFAIIASVIFGTWFTDIAYSSMANQLFNGVNSIPLLAVPFFLLVGELLTSSNITDRLIRLAQVFVGHVKGGLAQVVTLFSIVFSGVSGSSTADVAAMSKVMLPAMKKEKYDMANSAALIAAASTIANMIPPSIMAIVYGATGGVSITALFLGGVVPGLVVGVGLMAFSFFFGFKHTLRRPRATRPELLQAVWRSLLPLGVPVIILGGILTGQFTPTEAGMAAVAYTVFILFPLIARGRLRHLFTDFKAVAILYTLPLMAVAAASAFAYIIAYLRAPQLASDAIAGVAGDNGFVILLLLTLLLIIAGDFLDAIPAIVIFMPVIQALQQLGNLNPVHVGVVVVVTLAFGMITPPYGLSLLLSSSFAGVSFSKALARSVPIYGVFLIAIFLVIVIPDLALWLPRQVVPEAVGCFANPDGGGWICP